VTASRCWGGRAMYCLWRRICQWLGINKDDESDSDILLHHFMRSLRDDFLQAQHPSAEPAVVNEAVVQRIGAVFNETGDDWERAYEIQRLLVFIKPNSKLAIEAERRVTEAEGVKLPSAASYRAQLDGLNATLNAGIAHAATAVATAAVPGNDQAQRQAVADQARASAEAARNDAYNRYRAILSAVFDDLQWLYQKRNLVRSALYDSADNLVCFGEITLLFAASPILFFFIERQFGITFFSKFVLMFPNYGLYTAASFGLVGAFFSRLLSLKFSTLDLTVEDAQNLFGKRSLLIRAAVGISGAIIVFFLLRSQIIGLAAPDFTKLSFEEATIQTLLVKTTVLLPSKDWALLVIWSVLAGFSEKLVPDSLARAEGQVTAKKQT